MQTRVLWLMWGVLIALLLGGWLLDGLTRIPGTEGTFKAVLPAATTRARRWSAGATLVGFSGRDLVDGQNGATGAWVFDFADLASRSACQVTVADHVVALQEIAAPLATDPVDPSALQDSDVLARELTTYGMVSHAPATMSFATGQLTQPAVSGPMYIVTANGPPAGTWLVDARDGALLKYQPSAGMNPLQ